MKPPSYPKLNRRNFIWTLLAASASYVVAACGRLVTGAPAPQAVTPTAPPAGPATTAATQAGQTSTTAPVSTPLVQALPPTPACGDDDDPTPPQTEGPFFTPDSPERTSLLEPGMAGTPMVLTGYVLSTGCQPIANALVDFWHANDAGEYDNVGYTLRGHQFTDAQGRFSLETIMPGLYPGRTRHFHVKVQAANQPVLTTQLYFPGEPSNQSDGIFSPDLLMEVQDSDAGKNATFSFVLEVG
jgi:protocatechuate 3,4-dioxygenase beta subunit